MILTGLGDKFFRLLEFLMGGIGDSVLGLGGHFKGGLGGAVLGERLAGEQPAAVPRQRNLNHRRRLEGAGRTGRSSGGGGGRFILRYATVLGERLAGQNEGRRSALAAGRRLGSRRGFGDCRGNSCGVNLRRGFRLFLELRLGVGFHGLLGGLLLGLLRRFGLTTTATAAAAAATPAAGTGFAFLEILFFLLDDARVDGSGLGHFGFFGNDFDSGTTVAGRAVLARLLLLLRLRRALLGARGSLLRRVGVVDFTGTLGGTGGGSLLGFVGFFRVFQFHEISYIEEGVAFQANVHKSRLHAGSTRVTRPL